jgi:hypothetical protein
MYIEQMGGGGFLSCIAIISERNRSDEMHLLGVIGQKSAILSNLVKE